jgi:hypothetical protein
MSPLTGTGIAVLWRMSDVDYLLNARATLDALGDLLSESAEANRPVSEIADEALALLQEARSVLDAFGDDEATE